MFSFLAQPQAFLHIWSRHQAQHAEFYLV